VVINLVLLFSSPPPIPMLRSRRIQTNTFRLFPYLFTNFEGTCYYFQDLLWQINKNIQIKAKINVKIIFKHKPSVYAPLHRWIACSTSCLLVSGHVKITRPFCGSCPGIWATKNNVLKIRRINLYDIWLWWNTQIKHIQPNFSFSGGRTAFRTCGAPTQKWRRQRRYSHQRLVTADTLYFY
jgi:hypothetical protein